MDTQVRPRTQRDAQAQPRKKVAYFAAGNLHESSRFKHFNGSGPERTQIELLGLHFRHFRGQGLKRLRLSIQGDSRIGKSHIKPKVLEAQVTSVIFSRASGYLWQKLKANSMRLFLFESRSMAALATRSPL